MSWYAAHIVLYVQFREGRQLLVPVWENVLLVQADSQEEALTKAEKRGQQDAADDDPSFQWGGRLARWCFAGVRKLTQYEPNKQPEDGSKITYSQLRFHSLDDVRRFVDGQRVAVYYD